MITDKIEVSRKRQIRKFDWRFFFGIFAKKLEHWNSVVHKRLKT